MAKSRKHRKKKILQNGGTLFEINHDQLKELVHIGKPYEVGNMISCGACAMNQLGFPEDLVNKVSTEVNRHGGGFPFLDALNIINKLQYRRDPTAPPASIYTWAVSSGLFGGRLIVERSTTAYLAANQRNMTSLVDTMNAIKGIIETMDEGTGALLAIMWVGGGGHYVVIAKSNQGTPYIIETQHGGMEGVYRGSDQVKNYFKQNVQVGYFMTFNNSQPYFDEQDQAWRLPQPDPEIKLNRTSLRLARHMGDKRLIHADVNRTTKPPRLQRSKSFMPVDESYAADENTDSEDEDTTPATPATPAFGQPTPLFGQPIPSAPTPSASTSAFGQPQSPFNLPTSGPFAQPTPSPPIPSASTPAFGQPTPLFAQPTPSPPTPSASTPAFGQPTPLFGQPIPSPPTPSASTPAFGKPAFGKPAFGQPTPAFGKPAFGKPAFGQPTPAFGKPAFGKRTPAFGKPAFGQPTPGPTPMEGITTTPSFGQPQSPFNLPPSPFNLPTSGPFAKSPFGARGGRKSKKRHKLKKKKSRKINKR